MDDFIEAVLETFEIVSSPFGTSSPFILMGIIAWKAGVFDISGRNEEQNEKETSLYICKEILKFQKEFGIYLKNVDSKLDEIRKTLDKLI